MASWFQNVASLPACLVVATGLLVVACRDQSQPANTHRQLPTSPVSAPTALVIASASSGPAQPGPSLAETDSSVPPLWIAGTEVPLESKRAKSVEAYCRDYVTETKKALAGFQSSLPRRPPSCRPTKLPIQYQPAPDAPVVTAVALEEGLASLSRLLVTLPDGVVALPIDWAVDLRHSSQSPQHGETLEGLTYRGGHLIAVVGRAQGFANDDGSPAFVLRRSVVSCNVGAQHACYTYYPDELKKETFLGMKVRAWEATSTAWSTLPWRDLREFDVEDGRLRVLP